MDFLAALWIPILASAVAVWIASAVIWMALPHHRKDMRKLPDEDAFMAQVRAAGISPGAYAFPYCPSHADGQKPEFKKKWEEGPTGYLSVWGKMSMGRNMILTFLVYLVTGTLIAYLGWAGLPHEDAGFGRVMQVTGTAGVLAYCIAFIPNGIWFQMPGRAMLMNLIDGVAYGLITGAIFGVLWP